MGSDAGSAAGRMASILDIATTCASKNKRPAAHQMIVLPIAISPKVCLQSAMPIIKDWRMTEQGPFTKCCRPMR